ncbi:MAG: hypothetical protein OXL39_10340 [Caldilineaceae bacterium]|nr:hypothetical protein [Caldilineaceae bacterium]
MSKFTVFRRWRWGWLLATIDLNQLAWALVIGFLIATGYLDIPSLLELISMLQRSVQ